MDLGIDENRGLIFEGSGFYGPALVPTPNVSQANVVPPPDNPEEHAPSGSLASCKFIFREGTMALLQESAGGDLYTFIGTQQWYVTPHPTALSHQALAVNKSR